MESTIVIKVTYGDTLRRFNAKINEVGQLDLDVGGLRGKVIGLFNFAPDTDVTLTYIDEDGDVVTLVDEEDLCDVVGQSLNPLRITVKLKAEKAGKFHARSSGNSTPMRSWPRVQYPLPNLNGRISEYLRSIPEPLQDALSKMAASSPLFLAELVDCLSKMGWSQINSVSEFQAGTESSSHSVASGSAVGVSMTNKETKALRDEGLTSYVFPKGKVEEPASKADQKEDGVNSTRDSGSPYPNADLRSDSSPSEYISEVLAPAASHDDVWDSEGWFKKVADSLDCHKSLLPGVHSGDNTKDVKQSGDGFNSVSNVAFPSTAGTMGHSAGTTANLGDSVDAKVRHTNPVNKLRHMNNKLVSCTYNKSHAYPFKRSYTQSDGMGSVFHRGIQCDGCGVHPIAGPRFKSKVKENYDLCSVCFSEMGTENEYFRIDLPAPSQRLHSFKGLCDPQPWTHSSTLPDITRGFEMKPRQMKLLDSRFIMDVNVMDGTAMAPSTSFTKIWRLRNNGTIVWPQGTKLVWIDGDKLSDSLSIDLQISADGIPLENELDVAADFTAPELPGRYISYWRMASPSGQKFGQRIWVLIQVDASFKGAHDSFQGLNLNLPPQDSGIADLESVNGNVEPMMVQPLVDARPYKNQELDFPTNDTLLVGGGHGGSGGGGISTTVPPEGRTSVSFPITQIATAVPSGTRLSSPFTIVPETVQGTGEINDVEQSLLKELEEMGFKQVDLNKEILRLNEYNLEQSLDDLCGIAEWDPILQEMGFCDKAMNKNLLKKNNGSIKRVVMDLITGEKP